MKNTKKITEGMSDKARYKILSKTVLNVANYNPSKMPIESATYAGLKTPNKTLARKVISLLGEQFNVYGDYRNADLELEFNVSRSTIRESVNKQIGVFDNMGKLLTCFGDVVENGIGIEAHTDKRRISDPSLKRMYVLMSAFQDEKNIIPVKMEIKELNNKPNKLYLFVSLYPIEKTAIVAPFDRKGSTSAPTVFDKGNFVFTNISIPQLVININPKDGDFLKYCPDMMLNEAQQAAKYVAIKKDNKTIKNKETLSVGSGRDISAVMRRQGQTSSSATTVTSGGNVKNNTKKNLRKKGGFWGL